MRIAALDLGSNSFHLVVAEVHLDGSFAPLVTEREMLRLGDLVARNGAIGEVAAEQALSTLARFRTIADSQHVDEIVAVGTSALREAEDGADFIDRAHDEVGIDIELVDGVTEARLIFTAIRASVLIDRPPVLAADLGGGSLELMVGDQSELSFAASVKLGVGRLTAELAMADPLTGEDRVRLERRVTSELAPVMKEVEQYAPSMFIGSSGTIVCLGRMAAAARDGSLPDAVNQLSVSSEDLDVVAERVYALSSDARSKLPGCDQRRAGLPAGVAVMRALMNGSGLARLTMSEWALREGIVLRAIGRHDHAELSDDPRAIRRASVLSLCRRSNWRQPHARHVAGLAVSIFDQTKVLHGLDEVDRELLEFSGLLHDIGEHVSRTDHDRHTAYLVENGGLRGFAPEDIAILSAIGRFHIRGTPRPSASESFGLLDADGRSRVVALVAILRLADSLDATHTGVVSSVETSEVAPAAWRFVIRARGSAELEQWTFRRKRALFERRFGVSCTLEEVSTGRDDYEDDEALVTGLG